MTTAMEWSVDNGSGRLLVITNDTGDTVTNVVMRLKGKAVAGMFSRRDWSIERSDMADGDAVQAPFRAAMGARSDPPCIEIEWTDPNGNSRRTVLTDLPL